MPELMTKQDAIEYLLYIKQYVQEKSLVDTALDTAIESLRQPTIEPEVLNINRTEIMRLCNEIEADATTIAYLSDNQQVFDCSHAILDRVKLIGKGLTGDAGSKID